MKKILVILVSIMLLLSLGACGKESSSEAESPVTAENSETVNQENEVSDEGTEEGIPGYEEALSELPETVTIGKGEEMFEGEGDKQNFTPETNSYFVGMDDASGYMNDDIVENNEGNLMYILLSFGEDGGFVQQVQKFVFTDEADAQSYYDYCFDSQGAVEEFTETSDSGESYAGDKVVRVENAVYETTGPNYLKSNASATDILQIGSYIDCEKVFITDDGMKKWYEKLAKMKSGK